MDGTGYYLDGTRVPYKDDDPSSNNYDDYSYPLYDDRSAGDDTYYGSAGYGDNNGGVHSVSDITIDAVGSAIIFNVIMCVILMGIYEVASRFIPSIYAGRKNHVADERVPVDIPASLSPLRWVGAVSSVSWSQVRKCSGLDAYMYLRYLQMCLVLTSVGG
eukprot:CAMPEP_0172499416 /NCGR_PEP_ID=MMETSP1066-20121228/126891_1 /TAXON_ID=671091 /ORGANISM="Coscinodiscus wailesii, Strain CCMP2513" /LENGTH=159 /DNA_ID=CAMNT_0013273151 /DNA_START=375 /DNA_END=851 /DNA_ORIENTATION=+